MKYVQKQMIYVEYIFNVWECDCIFHNLFNMKYKIDEILNNLTNIAVYHQILNNLRIVENMNMNQVTI